MTIKNKYNQIYKEIEKTDGPEIARIASSEWLSSQPVTTISTLNFVHEGPRMVRRSETGLAYVDFILADTGYDQKGLRMSEGVLQKWTNQINTGGLKIRGDFDHTLYDNLMKKGYSAERVLEMLKGFKDNIAESVKAVYDKGKMWLRALVNPDFEDMIYDSSGVSLEAELTIDDSTNTAVDGTLGGFSFITDKIPEGPINPRTTIDKSKKE